MDFRKDVLNRSEEIAVVVDFWAPWCGPCRFLGPVIEELEAKAHNWELVKVNTDEHPELMREYQIQGIPAVKMFNKGEVIAEFTGALPKHQIERWLEDNLPDERKLELERIRRQLSSPGSPNDLSALEDFVAKYPELREASLLLAQKLTFADPQRAASLVQDIRPGNPLYDKVEHINTIKELFSFESGETDHAAKLMNDAQRAIEQNNLEEAISLLIDSVIIDKSYADDLARRSLIALFATLGTENELTRKYRRKFDMALY